MTRLKRLPHILSAQGLKLKKELYFFHLNCHIGLFNNWGQSKIKNSINFTLTPITMLTQLLWAKYKKNFSVIFESSCADSSQFLNFSMRPPAFLSPHERKEQNYFKTDLLRYGLKKSIKS
jgi:hypothetical protein